MVVRFSIKRFLAPRLSFIASFYSCPLSLAIGSWREKRIIPETNEAR